MSSSESELTDLAYDELEDEDSDYEKTSRTRAPRKQATSSEYKLQNSLKPPRATTYTARALYQQIYNSDIDLSPEYQRDVVWPKEKQTNLIDSIYRNYYIPPIIFSVASEDDGSEHRVCIDGKQRLTSIQLFMDGLIPHRDPITGQKYWYKHAESANGADKKQELLPERLCTMFNNKQIVCVEYSNLSDLEERDIFKRVQQGMPLKPSEKLGVISTSRTVFIRDLLRRYVTDETLGKAISWTTSRGGDFRCFAHAVYCMERWCSDPEEVKDHGTIDKVTKWLAGPHEIADNVKAHIHEAYDIFVRLATTPKYSAPLKEYKKVSPAEMIFIPLLIFVHGVLPPEELRYTRRELCAEIKRMRHSVRQQYDDIRMNTRIGKFLIDCIRRIEAKEPEPVSPAKIKRKRVYKQEEEDDEQRSANTYSRQKPLTPDTPTMSSADLDMTAPSSSTSALKKRKKTSSTTNELHGPSPSQQPSTSLLQKTDWNNQADSFQPRIPLSPTSSGTHSTDRDIGRSELRGPLNGKVILNTHSNNFHIDGMSR
ncbi:hypothetical protein J3R30DRAFT_3699743 [Lentinula aciculospora]|uniref:GmrSD restriction endonucleases N-terminal domain-containing protein n=1 Tax=Lentinula aciculospora TaxID=153920 RepID=A0A9W9AI23_9AGAR|nr:hypothetical protein J3R30DRAFT_3699743 [Lentinula aciculospora]